MKNLHKVSLAVIGLSALASIAQADEVVVGSDKVSDMAISVYNNNLAFVKDAREVALEQGVNQIAFEGVAREMKPETVRIGADGVSVIEQNYDYNLLNPTNILQESVGKTVKTALYNQQTGQTTYDSAKILDASFGVPVLQFEYGIETAYPGRLIFENVPSHLRMKPTFVASLNNEAAATKRIEMAYLTGGVSWKADYTADVNGEDTLDLNGWITLNNNSGADYDNAAIQVIAGSVNQESFASTGYAVPMMAKAARGMVMENGAMMDTAMPAQEALGDYYLYTLPMKATVKDKQSKQVSLLSQNGVKFEKTYKMQSPLYITYQVSENYFKKANPEIIFNLKNVKEDNLGTPLPSGIVRFYDKDSKGASQFLGESRINQLAIGEKAELKLGRSFDIFASGKIISSKKISEDVTDQEVEIEFNNAKDKAVKVEFLQNVGFIWKIMEESIPSTREQASTPKWVVDVPANGKATLKFKIRVSRK